MEESELGYIINLRWIRPVKRITSVDTKLAEFIPLISSKDPILSKKNNDTQKSKIFGMRKCSVLTASNQRLDRIHKSSICDYNPIIRIRVFLPEFTEYVRFLGFKEKGKKEKGKILYSDSREAYLKAVVFSVVRQSIRSEIKAGILADIVKKLPYMELKYWATIFTNYYREYESRRALYRPSRAFREVYGLD
jgi:hypothetical protein